MCYDGSYVCAESRCDGYKHCSNGEDEMGKQSISYYNQNHNIHKSKVLRINVFDIQHSLEV